MTTDHSTPSDTAGNLLNLHTPDGLFVTSGGTPYWVFHDRYQRFAVQLKATSRRPCFSYHVLSIWPVAHGAFLGAVRIKLGAKFEGSTRNRAGFIVRKGSCIYLKATDSFGIGVRLLVLPYYVGDYDKRSIFYANWQFTTEPSQSLGFAGHYASTPAKTRPYKEEEPRPMLRLVRSEQSSCSDGGNRHA